MVPTLQSALLSACSGVRHGVWLRENIPSVVTDTYYIDDLPQKLCHDIKPSGHILLKQVHEASVHIVGAAKNADILIGDGLITQKPGLLIGVKTADCVPVLLYDEATNTIGVVHAGWRSAFANIIPKAIAIMHTLGVDPANVKAFIGPSIQLEFYEVDEGFFNQFVSKLGEAALPFFAGQHRRWFFNLPLYIEHALKSGGVRHIDTVALDTFSNPQLCYSHRRHQDKGRHLSYIYLAP